MKIFIEGKFMRFERCLRLRRVVGCLGCRAWSRQRRSDSPVRRADQVWDFSDEEYSQEVGLESPTYVSPDHTARRAQTTDNAAKPQTTREAQPFVPPPAFCKDVRFEVN